MIYNNTIFGHSFGLTFSGDATNINITRNNLTANTIGGSTHAIDFISTSNYDYIYNNNLSSHLSNIEITGFNNNTVISNNNPSSLQEFAAFTNLTLLNQDITSYSFSSVGNLTKSNTNGLINLYGISGVGNNLS